MKNRLNGLDTLRAVAIALVMLYHLNGRLPESLAWGSHIGWMGVDLFFALSGYLIGSQLLRPVHAGEPVWGTPARPLRQYLRQLATLARLAKRKSE